MTLVTFSLKKVHYSVDVNNVEEVVPLPAITPLANLPSFIRGIINLRGRAVPIMDLRKRLGLGDHQDKLENDVLVVKIHGKTAGLIVDKVLSVVNIHNKQLIEPPEMISGIDIRYISAVAQLESELMVFLNLDNILNHVEKDELDGLNITHKDS